MNKVRWMAILIILAGALSLAFSQPPAGGQGGQPRRGMKMGMALMNDCPMHSPADTGVSQ